MMLSAKRKNYLLKHYLKLSEILPNNVECSNCGAKNVPHKKYLLKDMTENKFITDNTKKIFEDIQLREVYITGKMMIDGKEHDGEIPARVVFNNVRLIHSKKDDIENIMSNWNALQFLTAYISKKYQITTIDDKTDYTDIETYTKEYIKNYQKSESTSKDGHSVIPTSLEIHETVTDIYNKHIHNIARNEFIFDQKESNRLLSKAWMEKNRQNLKLFCANCQ